MGRSMVVTLLLCLVVSSLTACATAEPDKRTATITKDPSAVYDCALSLAASLGYTPEKVDRSSGFFEATRLRQRKFDEPASDALTFVTIKTGDTVSVQVTATSKRMLAKQLQLVQSSDRVKEDAAKILNSCK